MKLRYLASHGVLFLALYHRIQLLLSNNNLGYVRVLTYHNIPENKQTIFKDQIHYLASNYNFLTPLQFQEFLQGKYRISGTNLLLTFDDGFKSNRTVAEEILGPIGIKGIFFVPTEFIGIQDTYEQSEFIVQQMYDGDSGNPEISSEMEPLTLEDIKYLKDQGHAIGSHTKSHNRLSELDSKDDLYSEIIESGDILEKKLSIPIDFFAYPFGDINSINKYAIDLIKRRYKFCFSGVRGSNYYPVHKYAVLRDSISVDDPLLYVRFIVDGGLDILYRKKVRRLFELTE